MKPYISPDVHAKLFGDDSPNGVLKELVRWMATPSYRNFLNSRGLSDSDSWVDAFKIAVMGNSGHPAQAPAPKKEEQMDDLSAEISF
jgi:hypothetical protein